MKRTWTTPTESRIGCSGKETGERSIPFSLSSVILEFLRRFARPLSALALITITYLPARKALPPSSYFNALASHFRFEAFSIGPSEARNAQYFRTVHPDFRVNAAWISSVGAAVSLGEFEGTGRPDDAVVVDPRTDTVSIVTLGPTGARELCVLDAPNRRFPFTAPMGSTIGDFNEDGKQDILVYYWGRTPVVYLNLHSSREKSRVTAKSFRAVEIVAWRNGVPRKWFTNCVTQADLDGDGHMDLIIGNYFPEGSEVLNPWDTHRQWMQASMSKAFNGGTNFFLLWQAATETDPIRFSVQNHNLLSDLKIEYGALHGWTLAVAAADLNGDLLPEVYFANDFGPDRLFVNQSSPGHLKFRLAEGQRHFRTPKSKVLGKDSFKGMGAEFVDLTNEGRLSLLVSNIAEEFGLLESHFAFVPVGDSSLLNRGVAPFDDRSEALGLSRSGWGWDIKGVDFDNDGVLEVGQALGFMAGKVSRWPELQELATGNDQLLQSTYVWPQFQPGDKLSGDSHLAFFARTRVDQPFVDIGGELGFPTGTVSRGIAIGDTDRDGRLDFVLANQWQDSVFYHNRSANAHTYIGLRICRRPNQHPQLIASPNVTPLDDSALIPLIGASVTIFLPDGSTRTSISDGGNGHSGRRSPEVHFGLGDLAIGTKIPVCIRWRNNLGIHQLRIEVAAGLSGSPDGWHSIVLDSGDEPLVATQTHPLPASRD
jgi:enediyne biosynthesis protein E4